MTLSRHHDHSAARQVYVEWEQVSQTGTRTGGFKRAWVRRPTDPAKDWANTQAYVSVAAIPALGQGPVWVSADFPVFATNRVDDFDLLVDFVNAISAMTGAQIP